MKMYYLMTKDAKKGPYSQEAVRAEMTAGNVAPGTTIWHEGMADWEPIEKHFPITPSCPGAENTKTSCRYSFIESLHSCLKRYSLFSGRAGKSEFWWFLLFVHIVQVLFDIIHYSIGLDLDIYFLLLTLPGLAVGVRRMHDIGKSGWYALIPVYNLILCIRASQPSKNDYGDAPLPPVKRFF